MDLYGIFYEDDDLWVNTGIEKKFFQPISSVLPKVKSWSKNIVQYGSDEKNNLSILVADDHATVVSVSLRISFIKDNFEEILSKLVPFFIDNDFYIISEDFHAFLPDLEVMVKEIRQSSRLGIYAALSKGNE